jgi:hypothetical protein
MPIPAIIVTSLATIKEWFKTGARPDQSQFSATWDSFWHKHEGVVVKHPSQEDIDNQVKTLEVLTNQGPVKIPTAGNYTGSMQDLAASLGVGTVRSPATLFKFIQKGVGNEDLGVDEVGDVFCGWKNDGTERYPEAEWLGGDLSNSDNFKPLIRVIIEN